MRRTPWFRPSPSFWPSGSPCSSGSRICCRRAPCTAPTRSSQRRERHRRTTTATPASPRPMVRVAIRPDHAGHPSTTRRTARASGAARPASRGRRSFRRARSQSSPSRRTSRSPSSRRRTRIRSRPPSSLGPIPPARRAPSAARLRSTHTIRIRLAHGRLSSAVCHRSSDRADQRRSRRSLTSALSSVRPRRTRTRPTVTSSHRQPSTNYETHIHRRRRARRGEHGLHAQGTPPPREAGYGREAGRGEDQRAARPDERAHRSAPAQHTPDHREHHGAQGRGDGEPARHRGRA